MSATQETVDSNQAIKFGAIVFGILALGVLGYSMYSSSRQAKLQVAQDEWASLRKSITTPDSAALVNATNTIAKKFPKSLAAFDAALETGDAFFQEKKYKEAGEWYQKAFEIADHASKKVLVGLDIAVALEAQGQVESALKKLTEIQDLSKAAFGGIVRLEIARVASLLGKKDDAKKAVQWILKEESGSARAEEAKKYVDNAPAAGAK